MVNFHAHILRVTFSCMFYQFFSMYHLAASIEHSNFGAEAAFVDCSVSCSFPNTYSVKPNVQAIFLILPTAFKISFQYQVASNPSSSALANIFDIYSYSLAKSVLSFSMEAGTNQMHINYNNTDALTYGPGVTFSSSAFTTFTLTVTPRTITLSNGVYSLDNSVRGNVFGSNSVMYISTNFMTTPYVSAGGVIKNIQITGPPPTAVPVRAPTKAPAKAVTGPTYAPSFGPQPLTCCATTNYASSWQSCLNSADFTLGKVTTCNNCVAYQCIDWTTGSQANQQREEAFLRRTGQDVYFGVGSYGNVQSRGALCYRITVTSVKKDLLVQVINQGADVPDGNFDLMLGAGGFGLYDSCSSAGTSIPMYNAPSDAWGELLGGIHNRSRCVDLPSYPICGTTPADNMQDLCSWSFEEGLRLEELETNPVITKMCQVACPSELYLSTGVRRSDEKNTGFTCKTFERTGGYLTRMMDCAKPTYGWSGNIKGTTFPGMSTVIPCRRDGYTRVNQMYVRPTIIPSYRQTRAPSVAPNTGSVNPTAEPSTLTVQPSATAPPTYPSTSSPTGTPTNSPSTGTPTFSPTAPPTYQVTGQPSVVPSVSPSADPTIFVSSAPTYPQTITPTAIPTDKPTFGPTAVPTVAPSSSPTTSVPPTKRPTFSPSLVPSLSPSSRPSSEPTVEPTHVPTNIPSDAPLLYSKAPTYSDSPTIRITSKPSFINTKSPIYRPSTKPTRSPSVLPTATPITAAPSVTVSPSAEPSVKPTRIPTYTRTANPSRDPSIKPSQTPSLPPTFSPSGEPTSRSPTEVPTFSPSAFPTPTYEPSEEPTPEPTPTPCICRYRMGCGSDDDCCSGLKCVKEKTYSSCQEDPIYSNFTNTKCFRSDSQYGCTNTIDCCNPKATCDAFVCKLFCSSSPTRAPTPFKLTRRPSRVPTRNPTVKPTFSPSSRPTISPTLSPTEFPTYEPTLDPTPEATDTPTGDPSYKRTRSPTAESTFKPTANPTYTRKPSIKSSLKPRPNPTYNPSNEPSYEPTFESTELPTSSAPTMSPSYLKTIRPSVKPSSSAPSKSTVRPSTSKPSKYKSNSPTEEPTTAPTTESTSVPSANPSIQESTMITFESMIVLSNITSGVTTLDEQSRSAMASTLDNVFNVAKESSKYVQDFLDYGSKSSGARALESSPRPVSIISYLQTSLSLASYPQYVSNPSLLFQRLRYNLTTALKNGIFQQVLRKTSVNSAAIITKYATTTNATVMNLDVKCPPSNQPTSAPVAKTSVVQQMGVTLLSLIIAAAAVGIAFICIVAYRFKRYYSGNSKRRKQNEQFIMNQKIRSQSLEIGGQTYDLQILFEEFSDNNNKLVAYDATALPNSNIDSVNIDELAIDVDEQKGDEVVGSLSSATKDKGKKKRRKSNKN